MFISKIGILNWKWMDFGLSFRKNFSSDLSSFFFLCLYKTLYLS